MKTEPTYKGITPPSTQNLEARERSNLIVVIFATGEKVSR